MKSRPSPRGVALAWLLAGVALVGPGALAHTPSDDAPLSTSPGAEAEPAADAVTMTAHFIDVGQGAATLFEFPCGCILIDTGGPDPQHVTALTNYLDAFFARRADLNGTIKTLFITHPHIDHTRGLPKVVSRYKVLNYVDDGFTNSSGGQQVRW